MRYLSSILFAASASLDSLLTGLLLGLRKIRIPFLHNLCISLITLLGSLLAIRLGSHLAPLFSTPLLSALEGAAGSAVLLGMGAYYLIKALSAWGRARLVQPPMEKPPDEGSDVISCIKPAGHNILPRKNLLLLSFALSINNMGIGIGAGIAHLPLVSSCLFVLLFSFLFLAAGNLLGRLKILRIPESLADLLCGILLILLGIFQLL